MFKLHQSGTTETPTTGTNVIDPKKRKYDEYSALPYAVGMVQRLYKPILTVAIVHAENGKLIIPVSETGIPVAGFGWRGEDRVFGYVQTIGPTTTPDTGAPWDIDPETGEVKGYAAVNGNEYKVWYWTMKDRPQPIKGEFFIREIRGGLGNQVLATVTANSKEELEEKLKTLSDTLDRTNKKPVTPERLKEAGFETEYLNAKCGECKHWMRDNQIFGHCALRRCPVKEYERRRCHFFEKWEPPAKTTHICSNCKHFLTTDEEYLTGTCGLNEEITFANSTKACFEPREKKAEPSCNECRWFVKRRDGDTICANTGLHISANLKGAHCAMFEQNQSTSIVRPKSLGTKTTH